MVSGQPTKTLSDAGKLFRAARDGQGKPCPYERLYDAPRTTVKRLMSVTDGLGSEES